VCPRRRGADSASSAGSFRQGATVEPQLFEPSHLHQTTTADFTAAPALAPSLLPRAVIHAMASARPLRSLFSTASSPLRPAPSRAAIVRTSACTFSTTTRCRDADHDTEGADRPRWQQTPPRMMAPYRVRPQAKGGVFKVNEDPRRLDDAYTRMLGQGGDKVLGDEVKWLAVTHKSFDHGRRGFNDRLAYLGMCKSMRCLAGGWGANGESRTADSRATNITGAGRATRRAHQEPTSSDGNPFCTLRSAVCKA
jgi:hypothetical protein